MTNTHQRADVDQFVQDVTMGRTSGKRNECVTFTVEFWVNEDLGVVFLLDASGHSRHLGPALVHKDDAVKVVQALIDRAIQEQTQ
jgi:hypothetical protein